MSRIVPAVALLCLALAVCAAARATDDRATIESVTTPAGHRFLFAEMKKAHRVAFRVAWPSNWSKEADSNPAVPFLGVTLMTRGGAGDMDAAEVLDTFNDLGATAGVWVAADHVYALLDVKDDYLAHALEAAGTVLAMPRFDERWLVRIRDQMHGQWKREAALSYNRGWDAVRRAVLGVEPINATPSQRDIEALKRVTRDDLLAWHARTFVGEGARIVVAGNLSRDEAAAAVDQVFAALPVGAREPAIETKADFSPVTILVHAPDIEKSMIGFVGPLPARILGGEYEDFIAVQVLGEGPQSRIFDAIRSRLRASYTAGATLSEYTRELRVFGMWGEVDTAKLVQSREAVLETYRRFREEGPTAAEVSNIKKEIRRMSRKNFAKPEVFTYSMLESVLDGTDVHRITHFERVLDATTARTVRERLRSAYPAPENLIQVIVTPDKDAVDGACVVRTIDEVDGCRAVN